MKIKNRILVGLMLGIIILFGISLGGIYASFNQIDIEQEIMELELSIPTNIFDKNGVLIAQLYEQKRELVPLKDIPQQVINAFIVYEDQNFYLHHGFTLKRIIGAFVGNLKRMILRQGGSMQGGSTITQQVAKRLFTEQDRSFLRKLKELWYSVQLEKHFSKNEILELYLNEIYFGLGANGIKAAAKVYFNKEVKELTYAEAAILAMLPQRPGGHSPIGSTAPVAQKRQKMVLDRLVENGYLTKEEAEKEYNDFWLSYSQKQFSSDYKAQQLSLNLAPYYVDAVVRELKKTFSNEDIYKKGLNVYTACDIEYSKVANKYLKDTLQRMNEEYSKSVIPLKKYFYSEIYDTMDLFVQTTNANPQFSFTKNKNKVKDSISGDIASLIHLIGTTQNSVSLALKCENAYGMFSESLKSKIIEGSIVSIEPRTGYVSVIIGGSGFTHQNQFNRAILGKYQPGSGIKPFIYAGALNEHIITGSTIVQDQPIYYKFSEEDLWMPENYEGTYSGYVRVRDALRKSINIPTIRILEALSLEKAIKYMMRFYSAEERFFPPFLSLGLGTAAVSPMQAAKGFSVLANQGKEVIPITVRYVTDREGRVLKNYEKEINDTLLRMTEEEIQIVSPQAAYITTSMLQDAAKPGGTAHPALGGYNFPFEFAGKTGTTQNWKDAWFNGYTSNLATVIWIGFDKHSSLGKGYTGGIVAAPIWGNFMNYLHKVLKKDIPSFSVPGNLVRLAVDWYTGLIASDGSSRSYVEYFIPGTQPKYASGSGRMFLLPFVSSGFESTENIPQQNIFNTIKQTQTPTTDDDNIYSQFP